MTTGATTLIAWHGVDQPPAERRILRAGPLTVELDGMDLRYIRLGDREIVRRIYVAVRDPNWLTIPAAYSNVRVQATDDSFDISFDARHQAGEIDFAWHGALRGGADGTISLTMDGEARRSFKKNRIGFCILHPMACAGAPCSVSHVDGSVERGAFPTAISPHQPFIDFTAITHEVQPGLRAEVRLEGDTFEMEDQRNWTDASFKTYSTPLRLPFPVEIARGTRIAQSVTLSLHGDVPEPATPTGGANTLDIIVDPAAPHRLPRLGLGLASHGQPLRERELRLLRALRPAHLRVDLDLDAPAYEATLQQATEQGRALDARLEAAIFVPVDAERALARFVDVVRRSEPRVARWLVFQKGDPAPAARWVGVARRLLAPYGRGVPVGGGSDAYFAQLNRNRPPHGAMDVVSYSINPQVHAFDDASLTETLAAQATTIESARQFCGAAALAVSPVTLKPRFNPDATSPEPARAPGALPARVDPRQVSLFGAAWTVGSVKYLAAGGADSVTYYETTGWRGVMETEDGSPVAAFPSAPGMVFPLYHALADVAEFADGVAYRCTASHPLLVDALAVGDGRRSRVLLANMTGEPRQVVVRMPGLGTARVRLLDEHSVERATREPEAFRREGGEIVTAEEGRLQLTLSPYAVARLDAAVGDQPTQP